MACSTTFRLNSSFTLDLSRRPEVLTTQISPASSESSSPVPSAFTDDSYSSVSTFAHSKEKHFDALSLLSLPSEILSNIFDHVVADKYESQKWELLPLGRTCVKLCNEVNRYLYTTVELNSVQSFNKFVSTILTSPHTIASIVSSFTYTAPGEFTPRSATGYQPSDLTPILTHLPTVLHICSNMESLVLENMNDVTIKDWEHLFPSSAAAVKHITKFSWSYYSGWRRGRNFSRVWFSVLTRFAALKEIRLANCLIDPDALGGVTDPDAFASVSSVLLENICWPMSDMQLFASLLPNVEKLDMKTIKVTPAPPTPYHPLPPMFKHLKSLSIDCPSRILSSHHHICGFLAPSLRTSLQSLQVSGGCSLCPMFFKDLRIESIVIKLSQLRVCHGFENIRDLNRSVVNYVTSNSGALKRLLVEAPSLAVVDREERNYGSLTDVGRSGSWVFADIDYRDRKRTGSSVAQKYDTTRPQLLGLDDARMADLETLFREQHNKVSC